MLVINRRQVLAAAAALCASSMLLACSHTAVTARQGSSGAPSSSAYASSSSSSSASDMSASNSSSAAAPAAVSSSPTASSVSGSVCSGKWHAEDNPPASDTSGGTFLELNIAAGGKLSGTYASATSRLTHIANAEFSGTVSGSLGKASFTDDGWGNSGTIDFTFNSDGTILAVVTVKKGENAMYGVRSGSITFVRG
jgi:hypothetical protein